MKKWARTYVVRLMHTVMKRLQLFSRQLLAARLNELTGMRDERLMEG